METCDTCKFLKKTVSPGSPPLCRRFPPKSFPIQNERGDTGFVPQFAIIPAPTKMWCGEWKLDLLGAKANVNSI